MAVKDLQRVKGEAVDEAVAPAVLDPFDTAEEEDQPGQSTPEEVAEAEAFERRVRAEALAQFKRLKDDAQAIYGLTRGRVGVRSPEEWAALLEEAGDQIGNGRFIVRCLGAERYLDPETVAVLITLRQNLIADLGQPTAADVMMIDTAIVAYYNMLRVQGWIGNLSLVVERDAFGEEPLNEIHGEQAGDRLEQQLRRLSEVPAAAGASEPDDDAEPGRDCATRTTRTSGLGLIKRLRSPNPAVRDYQLGASAGHR